MDCSQCPIHPTLKPVLIEYAKKSADTSAPWREPISLHVPLAPLPELTAACRGLHLAAHDDAGDLAGSGPLPARAHAKQPELVLHAADKRHPSVAGTYLVSCVVFAALTGKSPDGNSYLAGIDAPTAKFLQEVAWETVQDYYGK